MVMKSHLIATISRNVKSGKHTMNS